MCFHKYLASLGSKHVAVNTTNKVVLTDFTLLIMRKHNRILKLQTYMFFTLTINGEKLMAKLPACTENSPVLLSVRDRVGHRTGLYAVKKTKASFPVGN